MKQKCAIKEIIWEKRRRHKKRDRNENEIAYCIINGGGASTLVAKYMCQRGKEERMRYSPTIINLLQYVTCNHGFNGFTRLKPFVINLMSCSIFCLRYVI